MCSVLNILNVQLLDQAGLKWKGYNVPMNEGAEIDRDDKSTAEAVQAKKTFARGWAGKSWPGRSCGRPFTPDGSEFVNKIP